MFLGSTLVTLSSIFDMKTFSERELKTACFLFSNVPVSVWVGFSTVFVNNGFYDCIVAMMP